MDIEKLNEIILIAWDKVERLKEHADFRSTLMDEVKDKTPVIFSHLYKIIRNDCCCQKNYIFYNFVYPHALLSLGIQFYIIHFPTPFSFPLSVLPYAP